MPARKYRKPRRYTEAEKIVRNKNKHKKRMRTLAILEGKRLAANTVSEEERENGWTDFELKKYIAERDNAVNAIHGLNGVERPRETGHFGADDYNPHEF